VVGGEKEEDTAGGEEMEHTEVVESMDTEADPDPEIMIPEGTDTEAYRYWIPELEGKNGSRKTQMLEKRTGRREKQ